MADQAREVIGIEIVEEAVERATDNAKRNGIEHAAFYCGDAGDARRLLATAEAARGRIEHATVILDPPRKGCDEKLLELLKNMNPRKIVYVSCNSATLARDVKVLREFGYEMTKACAVDMFPQSGHVESVALLVRTDSSI